jgi:hypothetical protein
LRQPVGDAFQLQPVFLSLGRPSHSRGSAGGSSEHNHGKHRL